MSTRTGMDDNDEYVYVEWEDPTTTNSSSASPLDLLMRHSSPFAAHGGESGAVVSSSASSTLTERTTSPSLLLRPRSNPRTRTPMRYAAVMGGSGDDGGGTAPRPGGGAAAGTRITIRPNAGRAVGTTLRSRPSDHHQTTIVEDRPHSLMTTKKSNKQGPSHRKVRRWNNENFVHLAAELYKNNNTGKAAAHALLKGHAHAAQYRSIKGDDAEDNVDGNYPTHAMSNIMTRLLQDDQGRFTATLRDELFDDEVPSTWTTTNTDLPRRRITRASPTMSLTPEDMLLRIEPRLRNVVLRACENSMPASLVVNRVEAFLLRTHHRPILTAATADSATMNLSTEATTSGATQAAQGTSAKIGSDDDDDEEENDWWRDILLEAPTITHLALEDHVSTMTTTTSNLTTTTIRFLFDGHSPNGGFHRLLMHGLCQFHGLKASSTTMNVTSRHGTTVEARLLVATGTVTETLKHVKMVDYIMLRKEFRDGGIVPDAGAPIPNHNRMTESLHALTV